MDIADKVRGWRDAAAKGTLSREEMREAIVLLRGDRKMAVVVGSIKKAVKEKGVTNTKALLEDFASQMKKE